MNTQSKWIYTFVSLAILTFSGLTFLFYPDFFIDEFTLIIDLILCSLGIAFLIFQFISWMSKNLSNKDKSDSHNGAAEKSHETIEKTIPKEQNIKVEQPLKKTASELATDGFYNIGIGNIDDAIMCYHKAQELDSSFDLSLLKKRIDEENQRHSIKQEFTQSSSTIPENVNTQKPSSNVKEKLNIAPSLVNLDNITDEEMTIFFGEFDDGLHLSKNKKYYTKRYLEWKYKGKLRINGCAFFWGIIWLSYRKMYLYTFLFFLVPCGGIIIPFVLFLFGNTLYFKHARKKILKIKAQNLPIELEKLTIKKIGGISSDGLFLVLILFAIQFFIVIYNNPF